MSSASDRSPNMGCFMDHYDIRDYTLHDALQSVSQGQSEELEYVIVEYSAQAEATVIFDEKLRDFRSLNANDNKLEALNKYPITGIGPNSLSEVFLNSPNRDCTRKLSPNAIFVPLKPRPKLSIAVMDNKLVLVDGKNRVGNLKVKNDEITVEAVDGEDVKSLTPYNLDPDNNSSDRFLYLGSGFRKYELEAHHWSPVERQGEKPLIPVVGSNRYYPDPMCGANAGVALLEYFERAAEGRHLRTSRLFLHQAACQLLGVEPTSGVSIRAIVKAMTRFGVPPEENWPYNLSKLETKEEASSLCYSYARNYRATSYLNLERPGMNKDALIAQIKIFIISRLPVIFAFPIYDSIDQSFDENDERKGKIPFPTYGEIREAGHAAVIVGYDDEIVIVNSNPLGEQDKYRIENLVALDNGTSCLKATQSRTTWINSFIKSLNLDTKTKADIIPGKIALVKQGNSEVLVTKGAFKIRNSWGKGWGNEGYGWLPYAYVTHDYASDFWTILKIEWMKQDNFGPLQQGDDLVIYDGCGYGGGH